MNMFLAHGPLSFVLNETIQKKNISKLTKGEHIAIACFSIFFGILPDFDLFLLSMTQTPSFQHHQVITHTILFWVAIWVLLIAGLLLFKRISTKKTSDALSKDFLNALQFTFIIGVLSHLFADVITSYSQILFPSHIEVTLLGGIFGKNYFSGYLFSVGTFLEILIVFVFALVAYRRFFKEKKFVEYSIYALISISTLLLLFSAYMETQTYNHSIYIVNKRVTYDEDYDTLIDYQDPDTANNGRDNIRNANQVDLAKSVEQYIEGKYLATSGNNVWEKIKHSYGAFDSYRLLSQAFFDQNRAIEPVLKTFAQKKYHIESYNVTNSYDKLFYEYFNDKKMLVDFKKNVERGSIFFVINKNGELKNMGIVLNNNDVGIVLDGDKRVNLHTLDEVFKTYEGDTIKVQR